MLTLQTAANEKQRENMRKLKEEEAELLVSSVSVHAYPLLCQYSNCIVAMC